MSLCLPDKHFNQSSYFYGNTAIFFSQNRKKLNFISSNDVLLLIVLTNSAYEVWIISLLL